MGERPTRDPLSMVEAAIRLAEWERKDRARRNRRRILRNVAVAVGCCTPLWGVLYDKFEARR